MIIQPFFYPMQVLFYLPGCSRGVPITLASKWVGFLGGRVFEIVFENASMVAFCSPDELEAQAEEG